MIDAIKRLSLDIQKPNSREVIYSKKDDTGRIIQIVLSDGGRPYVISDECYAMFSAEKPDGNTVLNDCTIEGDIISYEFTPQTVSCPGVVNCEIKLYGRDDKLITSPAFKLIVTDTVYQNGDPVESSQEATALTRLISDATEAIEDSKAVADELIQSKNSGEFDGERGTGICKIKTAPAQFENTVNGVSVMFRVALDNVLSESKCDKILVGDILEYQYYHFPVVSVDKEYVYLQTATSIRGAEGPQGPAGSGDTVTKENITKALGFTPASAEQLNSLSEQKADKTSIPSKTSQLTNDSGYAKTADHYTKTESDDKYQPKGSYLTSVPSEYVTETELNNKGYATSLELSVVSAQNKTLSNTVNQLSEQIPSKTSQLTNDSGFLTGVPSEYVTETELNSKGYATSLELNLVSAQNKTLSNTVNQISEQMVTDEELDAKGYATSLEVNLVSAQNKTLINNLTNTVNSLSEQIANKSGYVAQPNAPEDTSAIWIDTDDDYDDGFSEAVQMALREAKASGEFDGYTPIKGKDYFTNAEKTEMVNAVISALPIYSGEVI